MKSRKVGEYEEEVRASRQSRRRFKMIVSKFSDLPAAEVFNAHATAAAAYHARTATKAEVLGQEITPHPFIYPLSGREGYAVNYERIALEVQKYKEGKATITHPDSFKIWVLAILQNKLKALRQSKKDALKTQQLVDVENSVFKE